MTMPALQDEPAYRAYYREHLANGPKGLRLIDGSTAPVYFDIGQFDHAFYRSVQTTTLKRGFDITRAERMGDIVPTLLDGDAERFFGWDRRTRREDFARCVCVATGDFVIVLRMGLSAKGALKGKFITCYVADNSIEKIRSGTVWDEVVCADWLRQ